MEKKSGHTHTVMSKKLAEALMEAGVQHFAAGGVPETQTFGHHTADNLGIGRDSFVGQGFEQLDALHGMNLYNAQAPDITRQNFIPQIAGTQAAQANTYMNQNRLAQTLLAQSQGRGPNLAQTQLANATGQNVQQQGALMASQRGANANPALMARQAAMQGGALQQQAVGQSASLQAQQQLAAQQALQSLYQQQATNAITAEQVQQQALAQQNTAINQGSLGAQTINANASGQNAQQVGNMQSGIQNALGGMMSLSDGGYIPAPSLNPYQNLKSEEVEGLGGGGGEEGKGQGSPATSIGGAQKAMPFQLAHGGFASYLSGGHVPGQASVQGDSEKNDVVPALLSPGEVVIPRSVVNHPDMEKKVLEFLRHIKPQKKGFGGVIEARKGKC